MPYLAKNDKIIQVDTKEHAEEFVKKYGFHYISNSTVRRIKKKLRKINKDDKSI